MAVTHPRYQNPRHSLTRGFQFLSFRSFHHLHFHSFSHVATRAYASHPPCSWARPPFPPRPRHPAFLPNALQTYFLTRGSHDMHSFVSFLSFFSDGLVVPLLPETDLVQLGALSRVSGIWDQCCFRFPFELFSFPHLRPPLPPDACAPSSLDY